MFGGWALLGKDSTSVDKWLYTELEAEGNVLSSYKGLTGATILSVFQSQFIPAHVKQKLSRSKGPKSCLEFETDHNYKRISKL